MYMHKYLACRFDQDGDTSELVQSLQQVLSSFGEIVQSTYGEEIAVKTKKPHFHYHIKILNDGIKWRKGIQTYVKRHIDYPELPPHSIVDVTERMQDEERWFRYVLKDQKDFGEIRSEYNIGFSESQLKNMYLEAKAERKISLEQYNKYENKLNNDRTERNKLWRYLDEKLITIPPVQKVAINGGNIEYSSPMETVASEMVNYFIKYNNYNIPMDLKRRSIAYLSYRKYYNNLEIARMILFK